MTYLPDDYPADVLRARLLDWFDDHKRTLPWRGHPSAYAVWVSEIMLQQTQVATVIPYFERWMARFPTVFELSNAPMTDVLSHWQGLGYYARARSLHAAARQVVCEFGGVVPTTVSDLRRLKGIGPYTAGAIASIAHGERAAAVDGNVIRVFSRLFMVDADVSLTSTQRALWATADALVPAARPGDWNQSLMELGATVCTPKNARCAQCPARDLCAAAKAGVVGALPVKTKRTKVRDEAWQAALVTHKGNILLGRRPESGLLGGLWDFPLVVDLDTVEGIEVRGAADPVHHVFSHIRMTVTPTYGRSDGILPQIEGYDELRWVPVDALDGFPMSTLMRKVGRSVGAP